MNKIEGESLVEAGGFEPPTPCLQSRCNDENTGSLNQDDRTETHRGAQPKDAEETQGIKRPWTPGPWKLTSDDTCFFGYITREGFRYYIFETAGQQEDEANARLIAAAPDFADGAEDFIAYEKAMDEGDDVRAMVLYASASKKLRAALAKALGGQP